MSLFDDASLVLTPNGYKASKLYSIKPTSGLGDMTVVRATSATRVNSAGLIESVATNVPRLDYPPLGGCPSILVEPARTNLVLRSEEFDNASWTKTNATITANVTTAPDGTMTADKLVDDATLNQHRINQTPTAAIGTYTFSVFLKKAEIDTANMRIGVFGADFNLTTGTTSGALGGITSTIKNYGNGWYRCSITKTTIIANDICRINLKDDLNYTYTGNGVDGFYLWGAQLELGSTATSYIPTVASSVTRNADVISKTGISSLIGQTEGTLYAEVNVTNWTNLSRIFSISDGTSSNRIMILFNTSNRFRVIMDNLGGAAQADISSSSLSNGIHKIAVGYKANDFVFYVDGVLIGSDSSATIPACSSVYLGKIETSASSNFLDERIELATLFQTRLTNAQLATLTTL